MIIKPVYTIVEFSQGFAVVYGHTRIALVGTEDEAQEIIDEALQPAEGR